MADTRRGVGRARLGLGLHDPDRRAGVGRDARVGLDDGRRRGGRRAEARPASATRTAPKAVGALVDEKLAPLVTTALTPEAFCGGGGRQLRNAGRPGIGAMAMAAVDIALWDLTARLEGVSLVDAARRRHASVPLYGSGGFCSYSDERLAEQLGGWVDDGIPRVKMKIGREPERDPARLDAARDAIGDAELFVDANGAYDRKQALDWAERSPRLGRALVRGAGLVRRLRRAFGSVPRARPVTTSPPASTSTCSRDFTQSARGRRRRLPAGRRHALRRDHGLPRGRGARRRRTGSTLSGHCAPQVLGTCCARSRSSGTWSGSTTTSASSMLFDGVSSPSGELEPDRSRPGHGLELKRADAERYAA